MKLCSICNRSFAKGMLVDGDASIIICTICDLRKVFSSEIGALREHLEQQRLDHAAETEALKVEINQLKTELIASKKQSPELRPIHTYSDKVKNTPCSPTSSNGEFQRVKRGAKPVRPSSDAPPLPTSNSFDVLQADVEPVEDSIVLVGDSLLRNQKRIFAKGHGNRKIYSYSGYSLTGPKRLESKIDDFTKGTNSESSFIIEIGTNDLLGDKQRLTPYELIEKYRSLLHLIRARSTSNKICIIGLLPVLFESLDDITDRKIINDYLSQLAVEENVTFVSWWSDFAHQPDFVQLFNSGGLHLSNAGDVKLGHLLNNLVAKNFLPIPLSCTLT